MRAALFVLLGCLLAGPGVLGEAPLCQTYVVKSGDSAWGIANDLGILASDLTAALSQCIGYVDGQTVLQLGQRICLPPYYPACQYVSSSGGEEKCKYYTVQQGDTLSSVAAAFNLFLNALMDLNSDLVDPSAPMRVGLKLRLPPWASSCPDPNSSAPSCRVYTVQAGDYMAYIAAGFGVSVDDLLSVNPGLSASSTLSPGQKIKVPPFPSTCTAGTAASFPTEGVTLCRAYTVQKGDALASIAIKFGTTVAELIVLNPEFSDPSLLQPGRQIKIPKWDQTCSTAVLVSGPGSSSSTPATVPVPSPLSPKPATSPKPASPSPSPSSSPSPSPSPSPVPSPSPLPSSNTTATAPAPAPSTSITVPDTFITVDLVVTGASVEEFSKGLATLWIRNLADLVSLPIEFVTIESVSAAQPPSAARRRLQAATNTIAVSTRIATTDTAATTKAFQTVQSNGVLAQTLATMDLALAGTSNTAKATGASGGSKTGAIVGGVVGGVAGVAAIAAVALVVIRRRRDAALQQSLAGRSRRAQGGSASLTINTVPKGKAAALAADEATGRSSSPRALTPRRTNAMA